MLKLTPERRVLFVRSLWLTLLVLFGVFSFTLTLNHKPLTAYADSASTVNFQARLQTAAGAIVPDGDYNVEFKLYDDATLGGAHLLWTETRTGANTVAVKNGYLSVNLGSVTAFGSIDWSQKLWLTMNIGGTGTPSWDGEMSPRLPLTAIPYAFQSARASQADQLSTTANGNTSTLSIQGSASGHGNQTFVIQDQGAAGTYNLLTQNQADAGYVKLQGGSPVAQTGNIDITGTVTAGTLQGDLTTGYINGNGHTVQVNYNSTNGGEPALNVRGGIGIYGMTSGDVAGFTTPGGASRTAAISIASQGSTGGYAPISIGITSTDSDADGYGIIAFDQRGYAHNPTIAIASPDENQNFGLSFEGSNTTGYLKTSTNNITLKANGQDILTATNNSGTGLVTVAGGLQAASLDAASAGTLAIGNANATTINIAANDMSHTINIGTGNYDQTITIGNLQGASATVIRSGGGGTYLASTTSVTVQPAYLFEVQNASNAGVLTVDAANSNVYTGFNTNLEVRGTAKFDYGISIDYDHNLNYITPYTHTALSTAINVPTVDVPAYGTIFAFGLSAASDSTSRGMLIADGRTTAHQPTIGILSPDEDQIFGLSYDGGHSAGSSATGYIKNTANNIALQANGLNILTATNSSGTGLVSINGNLQASSLDTSSAGTLALGGSNATGISLGANTTLAAGKTLTITGDVTANRPSSPTEGMMYYDTTTKQLLTYSNGKWQGDRSTTTKIVAASNASQAEKDGADYVATGSGDQSTINSALTAAAGGKVYLTEGTYTLTGAISVPNNTTLAGAGVTTVLTVPNAQNGSYDMIANTDTSTGTNVTIRDLKIDGNSANQTSGTMYGIHLNGVGSGSGSSAIPGPTVSNVTAMNVYNGYGIAVATSFNGIITGNTTQGNGSTGILAAGGQLVISNNITQGNSNYGIYLNGASTTTVTGNYVRNGVAGIYIAGGSKNDSITGNNVNGSVTYGIYLYQQTSNNNISGNVLTNIGGNANNNAIVVESTSSSLNGLNNTITGNSISDTSATTTNYAIKIIGADTTNTYLSNNTFTTTPGGATINDAGTGTVYANQPTSESGGNIVFRSASSTSAFQIQNAGGTSLFNVNSSSSIISIGDATNGGTFINYGSTLNKAKALSNFDYTASSNTGTFGSAASTVDKFTSFTVNQTTSGQTLTLASPSDTTAGRTIYVANIGSTSVTVGGVTIPNGSTAAFFWNGTTWTSTAVSTGGSIIGTLDGNTASANGASIVGNTIYLQSASGGTPGLMTGAAQSFNGAKTFTGNILLSNTSTAALKIQDASNNALFTADTSTGTITFGTGSNTLVFTASGGLVASGTAQHTKTILLTPEYAGAVLDAASDSSCTSANNGTLTAGYDSTNRMNFYNWISTQTSAQCYDVVVQVPIPSDFSSWSGTPDIEMKKDSTGTGAYAIQIIPSSSTDANYGSYVSPGTLSTSWGNMATSSLSGTYTAGNYLTIKIRVTSTSSANVQLGNIKLTYNSKF